MKDNHDCDPPSQVLLRKSTRIEFVILTGFFRSSSVRQIALVHARRTAHSLCPIQIRLVESFVSRDRAHLLHGSNHQMLSVVVAWKCECPSHRTVLAKSDKKITVEAEQYSENHSGSGAVQ